LACNGIEGYNLACRQCAGKGVINENAYARVKIPRHSRVGQQIIIAGGGNEDLNGNHGPLMLRLVDAEGSGEPRPITSKSPKTVPGSEPTAARKGPVDLNDMLPSRRTGPVDLNGLGPRDINGASPRDLNGPVDSDAPPDEHSPSSVFAGRIWG
jgi:hypothetical protein